MPLLGGHFANNGHVSNQAPSHRGHRVARAAPSYPEVDMSAEGSALRGSTQGLGGKAFGV